MVTYNCNRCDKLFHHKNDYIRHVRRTNPCPLKDKIKDLFFCPNCNKDYNSLSNLNRHIKQSCKKIILVDNDNKNIQPEHFGENIMTINNYLSSNYPELPEHDEIWLHELDNFNPNYSNQLLYNNVNCINYPPNIPMQIGYTNTNNTHNIFDPTLIHFNSNRVIKHNLMQNISTHIGTIDTNNREPFTQLQQSNCQYSSIQSVINNCISTQQNITQPTLNQQSLNQQSLNQQSLNQPIIIEPSESHINHQYNITFSKEREMEIEKAIEKELYDEYINNQLKSNETFVCEYCDKSYMLKHNLSKHLKTCKTKKIIEQKDLNFKILAEKIDILNEKINKTDVKCINNNINNNITNKVNSDNTTINSNNNIINNNINVKLCAFGEEDLSFISDSKLKDIMSKGFDGIKYIIEYVHFNKNKPEFHNIYLSSLRENYVSIYDGTTWMVEDKKKAMEKLIDNKMLFLEEKYEELEDTLPKSTKYKFERVLELNQEKIQRAKITNEIRYILFNKKDMVIAMKNKVYENEIRTLIG